MDNVETREPAARQHQNMLRNTRENSFIEYLRTIIKRAITLHTVQKLKFKLEETVDTLI